jgi:hypothetical protein
MLREIISVIKKELRVARRDPRYMAPSMIVPLVFMLVYSLLWSATGGGEAFACGLVIEDQSPQAMEMAAILENMKSTTNYTWFSITRYNASEAAHLLDAGLIIAYIVIPEGFGANISSGQSATLVMHINNANDDIVKNYVHRIEAAVLLYNQGAFYPEFDQSGARIALDETLNLEHTPTNISYTACASVMLSVVVCALAGQALLTAGEFETAAVYDALTSPAHRGALVIGRTLTAIPRTFLILIITYPVAALVFGLSPVGNPLLLILVITLTILGLVPLGEILGILAKKREQALLAGVLLSVLCFFAGGGLAPIALLPSGFRFIAYLLPATHGMAMWNRLFFFDTTNGLLFSSSFLIILWILGTIIAIRLTDREVERS